MPIPADCSLIRDGLYIRNSLVEKVLENGPRWKFHDLHLVVEAWEHPTVVYEGLGREDCLGARCYCATLSHQYTNNGERVPVTENVFFMVYTEPVSGGEIVWDWGWRPEDEKSPGQPAGWETFGRQI